MESPIELSFTDTLTGAEIYFVSYARKDEICAGGLRISESVTLEEIKRLAFTMDKKFEIHNFPVRGAKSGIKIPDKISLNERKNILKYFVDNLEKYLISSYFIGQDMGCKEDDLNTIYQHLDVHRLVLAKRILKNTQMKSLINAVPDFIIKHSFPSYDDFGIKLTSEGIALALKKAMINTNLKSALISIQGVGSIGENLLRIIDKEKKYSVYKISDIDGTIFFQNGADISDVTSCLKKGVIDRVKLKEKLLFKEEPFESWCEGDVDILVPCGVANSITKDNIFNIRANIIVEGANISMSSDVEEELFQKGKLILPDILVNSAMSCSFGLMVSNQVSPYFKSSIRKKTLNIIGEKIEKLIAISKKRNMSIRNVVISCQTD